MRNKERDEKITKFYEEVLVAEKTLANMWETRYRLAEEGALLDDAVLPCPRGWEPSIVQFLDGLKNRPDFQESLNRRKEVAPLPPPQDGTWVRYDLPDTSIPKKNDVGVPENNAQNTEQPTVEGLTVDDPYDKVWFYDVAYLRTYNGEPATLKGYQYETTVPWVRVRQWPGWVVNSKGEHRHELSTDNEQGSWTKNKDRRR